MSLEKIDALLRQLGSVYETDEVIARTYGEEGVHDWRALERFLSWICSHSQNALSAAKNKDEAEVNQELGRAVLMISQAASALGHDDEARTLLDFSKKLRTAKVAEGEVDEASLSRVLQHFREGEFGIVSAFRPQFSDEENMARQFTLGQDVRRLGLGFISILGKWGGVSERSLFVPKISKEQVLALGDRYDQEAVIHGARGTAELLTSDGKVLETFKNLRVLALDTEFDNYSALRTKGGKPQKTFRLEPAAAGK